MWMMECLLHDIICLANNIENRDCYIIIGIDENNDFEYYSTGKSMILIEKTIMKFYIS